VIISTDNESLIVPSI